MNGDTAHELSEFGSFPWERMDEDNWFKYVGGHGCGGVFAGVDFNRPTERPWIAFYHDQGVADVWEIPPQLAKLMSVAADRGRDEVRQAMRNILQVAAADRA